MTERIVEQPSISSFISVIDEGGVTVTVSNTDVGIVVPGGSEDRVVVVDSDSGLVAVLATERITTDTPVTSVITAYIVGPRGEQGPAGSGGGGGGAQSAIRIDATIPAAIYRAFAPPMSLETDSVWDHSKIVVGVGDAVSVLWASGKHPWADRASLAYS